MTKRLQPGSDITVISPGFGPTHGGVGVVASQVMEALAERYQVSARDHDYRAGKLRRRTALLGTTLHLALHARQSFLFYCHIDVAQTQALLPPFAQSPYALFLHGMEVWKPLGFPKRKTIEQAALLMANSAETVRRTREFNPWLPPVRVVHLGVGEPLAVDTRSPRKPYALIVGRMAENERMKGHDEILNAWTAIQAGVPAARLLVAGSGDDRARLEGRVRQEQVPNVDFLGFISDEEKERLMRECAVFLFPSRQEGFGLAAVEAAAAGMAVVAFRGTVMQVLFSENDGVTFADSADQKSLLATVVPLLGDPIESRRRGLVASAHVRSRFLERHFHARLLAALHA